MSKESEYGLHMYSGYDMSCDPELMRMAFEAGYHLASKGITVNRHSIRVGSQDGSQSIEHWVYIDNDIRIEIKFDKFPCKIILKDW